MRPLPDYLPYRQVSPPQTKRWMSIGAVFTFASGGGMALLPAVSRHSGSIVWGISCAVVLTGIGWLIRQFYYRMSLHHAQYYKQLVEQEHQEWWAQHQQTFGLREMVLLGPVGSETAHWLRLLKREHQEPEEKAETGGQALRLIHSFVSDPVMREQQLARMLAQQWLAQRGNIALPILGHCYWQGSELAWLAFCKTVREVFPALQLPATPEKWQGEASLSTIASQINETDDERPILVAGCQSLVAMLDSARPAGESAVLWLVSREGAARVSRGEVYDADRAENIMDVCKRAMQQSETELPPDPCLLFTQPQRPELAQCGWNVMQHLQDVNWGETGQMEPLIVITLAAIFASQNKQPCGWIARDPNHSLALGIVTSGESE